MESDSCKLLDVRTARRSFRLDNHRVRYEDSGCASLSGVADARRRNYLPHQPRC
jgi:hypothetical protein